MKHSLENVGMQNIGSLQVSLIKGTLTFYSSRTWHHYY